MPPPVWTGTSDRRADRAQGLDVLTRSEGAVQVDDVQRRAPAATNAWARATGSPS
jgi:hypothetical protein